jgi:hypothetical protein
MTFIWKNRKKAVRPKVQAPPIPAHSTAGSCAVEPRAPEACIVQPPSPGREVSDHAVERSFERSWKRDKAAYEYLRDH